MYRSFYNLKLKPFQISADPKFLWLGENHKEGLATLKYGILDNRGVLLLTGEVGTGKTTLINALVSTLGKEIIVARIPDPGMEKLDFFNFISHSFKFKKKFRSKGEFLIYFSHFLHRAYNSSKKVLLIIDEAQRLNQKLLEEMRLLSNIEAYHTKLINIFLIGQDELHDILSREENRALRQRITIEFNLERLTKGDTEKYITHRLKVAGSDRNVYSKGAIHKIFSFSRGTPRLINIICDHALLAGYVKEKKKINAAIVRECIKDLRLSDRTRKAYIKRRKQAKKKRKSIFERFVYYTGLLVIALIIAGLLFYFANTLRKPASVGKHPVHSNETVRPIERTVPETHEAPVKTEK